MVIRPPTGLENKVLEERKIWSWVPRRGPKPRTDGVDESQQQTTALSTDISARGQMDVKIFNVFLSAFVSQGVRQSNSSVFHFGCFPLSTNWRNKSVPPCILLVPVSRSTKSFGQFVLTRRIFVHRNITKRTIERWVELGNFPRVSLDLYVKFFIL
jgi:hypothetical protein